MTKKLSIKPQDWFDTRELRWAPVHFTRCPVTVSKNPTVTKWIMYNTHGRYAFHEFIENKHQVNVRETLSFEDPQEAMLFTLWYQQQETLDLF